MRITHRAYTHAFGIDISDGSIEIVDLKNVHGEFQLDVYRHSLPSGLIVHGRIQDRVQLATEVRRLAVPVTASRRINVVCALPDAQVIVKQLPIPDEVRRDYATMAQLVRQWLKTAPHGVQQPLVQWRMRSTAGNAHTITLFITSRSFVAEWHRFFREQRMRLTVMEMESLALARALLRRDSLSEPVALLDLGFRATNLTIFDSRGLLFSSSVDRGGHDLTHELAAARSCSEQEAETYKLRHGLSVQDGNDVARDCIKRHLESTAQDLKLRATLAQHQCRKLVITGGGSALKGILPYLAAATGAEVTRGTIQIKPQGGERVVLSRGHFNLSDHALFAGSVGLALRSVEFDTILPTINFLDSE